LGPAVPALYRTDAGTLSPVSVRRIGGCCDQRDPADRHERVLYRRPDMAPAGAQKKCPPTQWL